MDSKLTHFDEHGRARMVDVSAKAVTAREAVAEARVRMQEQTLTLALAGRAEKGDVRAVAEIAGIMAAKHTAELIPMCHPLPLTHVAVAIEPDPALPGFYIRALARTNGKTGVEMEALTAASIAALTVYDMLKSIDRGMSIEDVRLTRKSGGASGDYERPT
ncbi:MAG: cyclic pyranopterin monophosphate synthase MoaC [Terricaulis sp.]